MARYPIAQVIPGNANANVSERKNANKKMAREGIFGVGLVYRIKAIGIRALCYAAMAMAMGVMQLV